MASLMTIKENSCIKTDDYPLTIIKIPLLTLHRLNILTVPTANTIIIFSWEDIKMTKLDELIEQIQSDSNANETMHGLLDKLVEARDAMQDPTDACY